MWFMHVGAPAHFTFHNRWIDSGGTESGPARSPDLNSHYNFPWRDFKTLVYSQPIQT